MATQLQAINTLQYDSHRCIGCGMCATVCPHGVFAVESKRARLVRYETCMECGACQVNCPTQAITVDSGVGCAEAYIRGILTGSEPRCDNSCCGEGSNGRGCC